LKRDYDVQVEQLRAQLQIDAAERNLRFSRVFARTAETIVTTYQKIVELKDAVTSSTMLFEGLDETQKKELAKHVNERWKEFESYYKQNKIYIPNSTAEKIREFSLTL
jgi:hypothetical protein